jgi:hypothetical protein
VRASWILFFAWLALGSAWSRDFRDSASLKDEAPPDRALSRSFMPPRFRVENPEARERIRAWFQRETRDSGQYAFKGSTLRLSGDGLRRLNADSTGGPGAPGTAGETSRATDRQRARRKLSQVAGREVEEDPVYDAQDYLPDDLSLQSTPQWGLRNDGTLAGSVAGLDIGMAKVWEKFDGDDSILIAVLDAGINFYHPDLQGKWFVNKAEANGVPGLDDDGNGFVDDSTGWDFVDGDNRPLDSHGHGTQLSGVIAARYDNATGIAGMLPRARILPVRVLSTTGAGYSSDIAAGMRYAARMGADVINFSIGIGSTSLDTVLRNGFFVARDSGVIVAAAAANDARDLDAQPRAPANYKLPNVYMVAAHGQGGWLSGFSNYGDNSVDLAAPGENIVTATIPDPVQLMRETFEDTIRRWTFSSGFAVGTDTLEGTRSLKWSSGNTATAVRDSVDLRGRRGGQVSFMLEFKQAGTGQNADWVYVEAAPVGLTTTWTTLGIVNAAVTGRTVIAFNAGVMDGKLFRLRFRTDFIVTATRALRIDDVRVKYADENPSNQAKYILTGGTSLAAPYVAGYAALMRVACARAGVPFTRERMLAGVTAEPQLAGKVITGGRLDVAKGLDFYLRTLPSLRINDSTAVSWSAGNPTQYTLSVRDSAGQALTGYAYAVSSGTAAGTLTGNQYNWNPGSQTGTYTVRFRAEKAPLVLRKQITFGVNGATSVAAAARPSVLRIGNREFLLPPAAFRRDAHALRVEFFAADGRTLNVLTGDLRIPAGARRAEYSVSGITGVGLRAWLDGVPLRSR